jgi:5-methylcytosine-specific restriction endonuclease McrA
LGVTTHNSSIPNKKDIKKLKEFVELTMSMTANYQPIIIRELLRRGGQASKNELAIALILEDQDEFNFWRKTVMRWPYETLRKKHGIVNYHSASEIFELPFDLSNPVETEEILELCEEKISAFKKKIIPKKSGIRYKLIEQSKGCCQACGAFGDSENPLDIDHIVPQSKAKNGMIKTAVGDMLDMNDEANLQVLCAACNRGKKDQGEFNFKPSEARLTEAISGILDRATEMGFDVEKILEDACRSAVTD